MSSCSSTKQASGHRYDSAIDFSIQPLKVHVRLQYQFIHAGELQICLACAIACKAKYASLQVQVLSTFDNGRVEGFLDMRTLTPVEMTEPSMARRIA